MISVSDCQLRIVAAAADLLPDEARGTFLRHVVAELRVRRDFSDSDVEEAVQRGAARSVSGGRSVWFPVVNGSLRKPEKAADASPAAGLAPAPGPQSNLLVGGSRLIVVPSA
jgi:hypothetical protein